MASAREIKRELRTLNARVAPVLSEFCDGYALIGLRAGTGDSMEIRVSSTAQQADLEDAILAVAAEIARQRQCSN